MPMFCCSSNMLALALVLSLASAGPCPAWAQAKPAAKKSAEERRQDALATLAPADRALAETQRYCAVHAANRLGSMGPPVKVLLAGKPVFLCCEGCRKAALAKPKETLAAAEKLKKAGAALARLPAADRNLAEAQQFCPTMEDSRLGGMGVPVKILIENEPVFLCCKGCTDDALANPAATLKKVRALKQAAAAASEE